MNTESHASTAASILSRIRNALIGTWLVVVCYGLVFYIVICAAAAYQVQRTAEEIRLEAGPCGAESRVGCTGAVLIDAAERLMEASDERGSAEQRVNSLVDSLESELEGEATEVTDVRRDFWRELDPLVQRAGEDSGFLFDPEDYDRIRGSVEDSLSRDDFERFDSVLTAFEQAVEAGPCREAISKGPVGVVPGPGIPGVRDRALRILCPLYEQERDRLSRLEEVVRGFQSDSLFYKQASRIDVQTKSLKLDIAGREVIGFAWFASTPHSVLVLLLAIAMGALGSTIHVTRAFLAGESQPMAWYLIRPMLGTVTAVAMYVLAKAGQLAFNPGEATGAMDPWFISFLAIVSGLMSDDAVRKISDEGKKFFATPSRDRPDRWALNLGQKMAERGADREGLARALGVPALKLDSWTNATEAVPSDAQDLIAAWLRKPVRELFSDQEPKPMPARPTSEVAPPPGHVGLPAQESVQ